jgi:hypothetical protein
MVGLIAVYSTDNRRRSVAGSLSICLEEIRKLLETPIQKARSASRSRELSEVQTELANFMLFFATA